MNVPIPPAILRDVQLGRPGAVGRLHAYVLAYAAAIEGDESFSIRSASEAAGLGRDAAHAIVRQARLEAGRTNAGQTPDGSRTGDHGATPRMNTIAGRKPDSDRTIAGQRPPPAGQSPDKRRTADQATTPAMTTTAGQTPDGSRTGDAPSRARGTNVLTPPLDQMNESTFDRTARAPDPAGGQPLLFTPTPQPASEAGRLFLALVERYGGPATREDLRWRIDPGADLAWYESSFVGKHADADDLAALRRWSQFLEDGYRAKVAGHVKAKFPGRYWKGTLEKCYSFVAADHRDSPTTGANHARERRGAFGARQPFDVAIVSAGGDPADDGWGA